MFVGLCVALCARGVGGGMRGDGVVRRGSEWERVGASGGASRPAESAAQTPARCAREGEGERGKRGRERRAGRAPPRTATQGRWAGGGARHPNARSRKGRTRMQSAPRPSYRGAAPSSAASLQAPRAGPAPDTPGAASCSKQAITLSTQALDLKHLPPAPSPSAPVSGGKEDGGWTLKLYHSRST